MKKKSILIKEFHHKELVKISNVFGVPYADLVQSMILYFKRTGINPVEAINENPATMVKALDKRIVSFLKVQERDILKPLRSESFQYSNEQKKQISELSLWIKDVIVKLNDYDNHRTKLITSELDKLEKKLERQQKAFIELAKLIDVKNKSGIKGTLKSIFE
ncbi:BfmA/BtgA family mobilization protein [Winogradskyella undariae]|uniref:BfmA/BtgA family mobilization protein n=1 Tax=Winogradskyella undariae TaxID=1285465 RepID=UPI0015CB29AA|nr:BfmA/BtgA family mobilization protein [Winogradskyella undariae]